MSEVVTLELRDELYAVLKQQAESVGISLADARLVYFLVGNLRYITQMTINNMNL